MGLESRLHFAGRRQAACRFYVAPRKQSTLGIGEFFVSVFVLERSE